MISIYPAEAKPDHLKQIQSIALSSYRSHFTQLYDNPDDLDQYLAHEYQIDVIRKSMSNPNVNWSFARNQNNQNIGIIKSSGQALPDHINAPHESLFLEKIYLLAEYTGLGYGAQLLNQLEEMAQQQQKKYMWLEVLAANTQGIKFYQKQGFSIYNQCKLQIFSQTFSLIRMLKVITQ